MRKMFLVLILFLFMACSATKYIWVPPREVSDKEFYYDYGVCDLEAKQNAAWAVGSTVHPNNLSLLESVAWSEAYKKTLNECMTTKGYNKVKK